VREPTETGYGSRLITQLLDYQFSGEVVREFRPDGMRCRIRLRLE
jgi:two-component sensor histidine kinase